MFTVNKTVYLYKVRLNNLEDFGREGSQFLKSLALEDLISYEPVSYKKVNLFTVFLSSLQSMHNCCTYTIHPSKEWLIGNFLQCLTCFFRLLASEKHLPHLSHANGFVFVCMRLCVSKLHRERFVTNRTCVWFFARVCTNMNVQRCLHGVGLIAVRTLMWSLRTL